MKLGGQQVELGRGQVATSRRGRGLGGGSRLLGASVRSALGGQQTVKAEAGLGGCFDVQQGVMGGE